MGVLFLITGDTNFTILLLTLLILLLLSYHFMLQEAKLIIRLLAYVNNRMLLHCQLQLILFVVERDNMNLIPSFRATVWGLLTLVMGFSVICKADSIGFLPTKRVTVWSFYFCNGQRILCILLKIFSYLSQIKVIVPKRRIFF